MTKPAPILLSLVLLGGCAAPATQSPGTAAGQDEIAAISGYRQVMATRTLDGRSLSRQGRPTAMVVFASWCGHCRRELAALGILRKKYPTLRIIGLNAYEDFRDFSDRQRLQRYLAESAPWLTDIVQADQELLRAFGKVPKIPTLFLYDGQGQVVAEFRRDKAPPPSHEELDAAIARAVGASQPPL